MEERAVYQVMPELSAAEYEALKADIKETGGVRVPVEYDEAGNVLDGHNRVAICGELGIDDWPRVTIAGLSEVEKRTHARKANLQRRHLSQEQKREIIAAQVRDTPELNDYQISLLLGVSPHTVTAVARPMEESGDICRLQMSTDTLNRSHPRRKPRMAFSKDARDQRRARGALAQLEAFDEARGPAEAQDETGPLLLDTDDVVEQAKRLRWEMGKARSQPLTHTEATDEEGKSLRTVEAGDWWNLGEHRLYCGSSTDLPFVSAVFEAKPAFAFADPPYNAETEEWDRDFEWQHDYLAEAAGVVAVTPGISAVAEFFRRTEMPYRWSAAYHLTNGQTRGAMGFGKWVYVALFSNGSVYVGPHGVRDHHAGPVELGDGGGVWHKGRKNLDFLRWLIGLYSAEGDLVVDPFLGSGTTLVAAAQMKRRCIGAELSPVYCSQIIDRWEQVTGGEARRNGTADL